MVDGCEAHFESKVTCLTNSRLVVNSPTSYHCSDKYIEEHLCHDNVPACRGLDERNAKVIIQIPKYRSECRNVCATTDPLSEIKNCLLTAFSTFTDVGILIARDYSSP